MIARLGQHLRRLARDDESGQAMVEFVIVFPVQLFFTLMVLQFAFIAHAHIVVSQAAFMGARAAAVWGQVKDDPNRSDAGKRAATRILALLTSGSDDLAPTAAVDADSKLKWKNDKGEYGFDDERENEAYSKLSDITVAQKDGYVSCDVRFDYRMQIPVANHAFHAMSQDSPSGPTGFTTFHVRRVGFIATPWTQAPTDQ